MRLPRRDSFPRVDDHLVEPEVTRDEIIGGQRIVAMPANPPHANQQNELDFILRTQAAPGYRAAAEPRRRHRAGAPLARFLAHRLQFLERF